ncbi:hypothetical protein CTI12_AA465020 [Artemisia annua]|uniref:Myb/SANT-like domain-containing protein n=1 Tax=Artemisia annua TaxID=35608 RepID=A0A2U1LQI9_ARTAN|nr:hypothetical protein CTI12_AA465020 [Artemisia annua]
MRRMVYDSDTTSVVNIRMNICAFKILCEILETRGGLRSSKNIQVDEQVAMFLHTLAHNEKNRIIVNRFQRSGETISRYFKLVLNAVCRLHKEFYKVPVPVPDNELDERWKWFKGCLGALDGTYVKVRVPETERKPYRTRKGEICTNVLGVCTRDLQFIYVLAGWEGSAADCRMLRDAISRPNGLKRCFGLIKARWAILRDVSYHPLDSMPRIIIACCLMHNFIRTTMREDPLDNEVLNSHMQHANDHDNVISTIQTSQGWSDRRDTLANEMFNEWNARRAHLSFFIVDMTDSSVPNGASDANVIRGAGKNKRPWTSEEDAKLIDALMELHVSGKYSGADNGFKPGYEKAVQALLDVSLPNSGLKADPHIKSRLKTLKKNFSIVHDMLSGTGATSGFGWDPEKCVLSAPDDVWTAYLKDKKYAAPFRNKALPYYEKLCTIFGKDRATGSRAEDLGDDEIVQETSLVSPIDVDADVSISSGVGNKRKRSKTIEFSETFKECSIDLSDKLEDSIGKLGDKIVASANQDIPNDILDEVITSIQGLPNNTPQQRIRGMHIIGRNTSKARIFLKSSKQDKVI